MTNATDSCWIWVLDNGYGSFCPLDNSTRLEVAVPLKGLTFHPDAYRGLILVSEYREEMTASTLYYRAKNEVSGCRIMLRSPGEIPKGC